MNRSPELLAACCLTPPAVVILNGTWVSRTDVETAVIVGVAIGSASLAGGLCRPVARRSRILGGALAAGLSFAAFFAFILGLEYLRISAVGVDRRVLAAFAIFAVVASAPAFDLSKSALVHRLEAEAQRALEAKKKAATEES